VLPQDHVLVAYLSAYCKEKLGEPTEQDYAAASRLSTQYIFPNRAETLEVLHAALQARPSDGTAHYLLGTLLFSRGLTDAAIDEWNAAAKLAPTTPVLHADLGNALLRVKRDASAALPVFRDGIAVDPKNAALYAGMDQALSILQRPASDRVHALEQYPDLANMPSALVYELALNRSGAGDFKGAENLFRDRFFPREEGGTNVRQVWVEVRLQEAISLERKGNCSAATSMGAKLGGEVQGLAFTRDGLAPVIDSARTQYLLGMLFSRCRQPQEAHDHYERAAQQTNPPQIFWAYSAEKELNHSNTAEWQQKLESALARIQANNETDSNSLGVYTQGLLESALGRSQRADATFQEALLLPDRMMAHHLSRLARARSVSE
jgi:tetratricopeptide (TPR) repeat protein